MTEEGEKTIDETLLERIFTQLDKNTEQITELIRITGEQSSAIGILKKIILTVFLFVFISFLGTLFMFTDITLKENIKAYIETSEEKNVGDNQDGDEESYTFLF